MAFALLFELLFVATMFEFGSPKQYELAIGVSTSTLMKIPCFKA
jgi:hypothetical protein